LKHCKKRIAVKQLVCGEIRGAESQALQGQYIAAALDAEQILGCQVVDDSSLAFESSPKRLHTWEDIVGRKVGEDLAQEESPCVG
jgi:hypothetical protein